jgi:hypothetical protein
MRTNRLMALLVGLTTIVLISSDASAYYHPTMGRFMQRDPGPGASMRLGIASPMIMGNFTNRDPLSGCAKKSCSPASFSCASSAIFRKTQARAEYMDGMNLYLYEKSNPLNRVDPHGLISVRCCWDMLGKALSDPEVGAAYDAAKAAKDSLGIPCLGIVKCNKSCIGGPLGRYNPFTRNISMCADILSASQTEFNQILLHELIHAKSICGWWKLGCGNCMAEEKRAYYYSGGCWDNESCTRAAWRSCITSLSCSNLGDSYKNYLGM